MFYNYVRPHQTLTKRRAGMLTTRAMAAGLADRPWNVYDLLDLLDCKRGHLSWRADVIT